MTVRTSEADVPVRLLACGPDGNLQGEGTRAKHGSGYEPKANALLVLRAPQVSATAKA